METRVNFIAVCKININFDVTFLFLERILAAGTLLAI